jgi:hypothetical protein
MRLKAATSISIVTCLFALSVPSFAKTIQESTKTDNELHYGSGSYQTFDATPRVEIFSFTTNEEETVLTSLKNWSQKAAVSVRIGWYLTPAEDYKKILTSGQTDLIELGTLSPGETIHKLAVSIVSKKGVLKALKGSIPTGDLFLGVAVNEIHFADGTTWKLKTPSSNIPMN